MTNVEVRLSKKKQVVEEELGTILSRENSVIFQAMRYAVLSGGKRYRPLLVLSSGECFGVAQGDMLPFAVALEMIHDYSLVHDDLPLMDNDDFRRGKPSSHKVYGDAVALLAGDGLLTLAFETMIQACLSGDLLHQKHQLMKEISESAGVHGMIGGQVIDITLPAEEVTEENIHELISKKTTALITASVKAGPILGKATPSQFEAVKEYGKNIGFAFQIRDDINDSTFGQKKFQKAEPNYVKVFGLEKSQQRLREYVETAIKALDTASLESEELRHLAVVLLD